MTFPPLQIGIFVLWGVEEFKKEEGERIILEEGNKNMLLFAWTEQKGG